MILEKRFAVFYNRLSVHTVPAGWVSSFEISVDRIIFSPKTLEEAKSIIANITESDGMQFYSIQEVYIKPDIK